MNMEQWWNDIFPGETEVLGENLPSATLLLKRLPPKNSFNFGNK
jgi:hypothetical protein